jgi:hypothetical protein
MFKAVKDDDDHQQGNPQQHDGEQFTLKLKNAEETGKPKVGKVTYIEKPLKSKIKTIDVTDPKDEELRPKRLVTAMFEPHPGEEVAGSSLPQEIEWDDRKPVNPKKLPAGVYKIKKETRKNIVKMVSSTISCKIQPEFGNSFHSMKHQDCS